jgi:hypothetical protein
MTGRYCTRQEIIMDTARHVSIACLLALAGNTLAATEALAVGDGLDFTVDETIIDGAQAGFVDGNSLDFTWHACSRFVQNRRFVEDGYLWLSSYQDADSVVPSQINYIEPNGYGMYMLYTYRGRQIGNAQSTPSGARLNYLAAPLGADAELLLDPQQDTVIFIDDFCQLQISGTIDDITLGMATQLAYGEKSETDGVANGDFELLFDDWVFTTEGQALFGNPAQFNVLVVNANLTRLGGILNRTHFPEGSGNVFWRMDTGLQD